VAVYTEITDEELNAFMADFDLGRATSCKGIAEGVENSNFVVETQCGRFILTIFERRVRADDLPFFLGLMRWLADRGFPSATPMADRSGRTLKSLKGKPASLIAFLPGLSARRASLRQCREAGGGLAWLHLAANGYEGRRANDLGHDRWAAMFAPLAAAAEHLEPGLAAAIDGDLAVLDRDWPRRLPEGIVHADFFPDNVFFIGGAFAGAIDFYFSAWDALAYDIAVALNAWCFDADGAFEPAKARAFIDGYAARRPLSEAEQTALPILAHGAALRFFLTRLADWGATPPGSLVRPKDPLEYARRLEAHREGIVIPLVR
jgi:homoserine kinase type II